jgi:hypothetical protein
MKVSMIMSRAVSTANTVTGGEGIRHCLAQSTEFRDAKRYGHAEVYEKTKKSELSRSR